jgi:hypothetical protein
MTIEKCHRCVGSQACQNQVVNECLPVSAFGNVSGKSVKVATIGLNPVLNEFYHPPNYTTLKNLSQRLAALSDYELPAALICKWRMLRMKRIGAKNILWMTTANVILISTGFKIESTASNHSGHLFQDGLFILIWLRVQHECDGADCQEVAKKS